MRITYIPPERIPSIYVSADKVRTVTLKNYEKEDITFSIYKTKFQTVSNKVHYYGLRIHLSNEEDQDFEDAVAESVHQMLVELNINEKSFSDIERHEADSWGFLREKCTKFVNENFNLPGVEVDPTYNYFITNLISYCMISAYCMLPNDYEETGDTGFSAFCELSNIYREIMMYDWDLGDVGKEIILKVPKEKVIKRELTYLELLIIKMKSLFRKTA